MGNCTIASSSSSFTHRGVPRMQKLRFPLVPEPRAMKFKDSFFLKPVVGHNIAFPCCACWQGFYLPSFCLPNASNFISPKVIWSSTVECVINNESELYLWQGHRYHLRETNVKPVKRESTCGRNTFCFTLICPFMVDSARKTSSIWSLHTDVGIGKHVFVVVRGTGVVLEKFYWLEMSGPVKRLTCD